MNGTIAGPFAPLRLDSSCLPATIQLHAGQLPYAGTSFNTSATEIQRKYTRLAAKVNRAVAHFNELLFYSSEPKIVSRRAKNFLIDLELTVKELSDIRKRDKSRSHDHLYVGLAGQVKALSQAMTQMKREDRYQPLSTEAKVFYCSHPDEPLLLQTVQDDHETHYLRGVEAYTQNNLELAQIGIGEATRLAPEHYLTEATDYHYFILTVNTPEEIDEGIKVTQRKLSRRAFKTTALFQLGILHALKGDFLRSEQYLSLCDDEFDVSADYHFLLGVAMFANHPDKTGHTVHFRIARNLGFRVEDELLKVYEKAKRPELVLGHFDSTPTYYLDKTTLYLLSDFYFRQSNWVSGSSYFFAGLASDETQTMSQLDEAIYHEIFTLANAGTHFDHVASLRGHLHNFAHVLESMTGHKAKSYEDVFLGSLYFLAGDYDAADKSLQRGAHKDTRYLPLLQLTQALLVGNVEASRKLVASLSKTFSSSIFSRESDGIKAKSLIFFTQYLFTTIEDEYSSLKNARASPSLDFVLRSVIEVVHDYPEERSSSWLSSLFGRALAYTVKYALAATLGYQLGDRINFFRETVPITPPPEHGLEIVSTPPQPPTRRRKIQAEKTALDEPPKEELEKKLRDLMADLFASSDKTIAFAVHSDWRVDGIIVELFIDCHAPNHWLLIKEHKNLYVKAAQLVFPSLKLGGTVESSRRMVLHLDKNSAPLEEFKEQAKEEIKNIDESVKKARTTTASPDTTALAKSIEAAFLKRDEISWEKALEKQLYPCGRLDFIKDEDAIIAHIYPHKQLKEHFLCDEGADIIETCIKNLTVDTAEVQIDYERMCIQVTLAKRAELRGTPDQTQLTEYIEQVSQHPQTAAPLPTVVEHKRDLPPTPSRGVTIAYVAPSNATIARMRQNFIAHEANDRANIEELGRLIKMLASVDKEPDALYAKKYLLVRFLEIYSNLSFFDLRHAERTYAEKMRDMVVHVAELAESTDIQNLCEILNAKIADYSAPYFYTDEALEKYSMVGISQDYSKFLTVETERGASLLPRLGDAHSLERMVTCCELFTLFDGRKVSDDIKFAHQSGVVLTLRVLLQQDCLLPSTKQSIELRLQRRRPDWMKHGTNILTLVGHRIAHGGRDGFITPDEMALIRQGLDAFKAIIQEINLFH